MSEKDEKVAMSPTTTTSASPDPPPDPPPPPPAEKKNDIVDFDELLPHIGEFGRYQITFYLLMCVPTMPAAFLAFNQVFLSAEPGKEKRPR